MVEKNRSILLLLNKLEPYMTGKTLLFLFIFITGLTYGQSTINPCARASTIHIVVLGSSTAAGSGPSSSDSAWVNRYRKYLQAINPNNTVTNLAIGGTTTYHIMPTWYVAPVGRPNTNPLNNVSRAIALNADAIIVNMPSNDAANGFGITEQMHNFITIDKTADSAGIPVWVCTTQPRNGFNAAKKAIQTGVRDSILSYFGSFAIDFWSGFADTNNNLLPIFDSGDGVHMNDTAHNIMNKLVIAEYIPNLIIDTLLYVDHVLKYLEVENLSSCGDSSTTLITRLANIGQSAQNAIAVAFRITNLSTNTSSDTVISLQNPLLACSEDSVSLSINTYDGVNLEIRTFLVSQDSVKINDSSLTVTVKTEGHPEIQVINDTVCFGNQALLTSVILAATDSVLWYDSLIGGNLIGIGKTLSVDSVISDKTFYAKAVRGGLNNQNSLFTSATTTTNWNGIMFDLKASDTLILDSLSCKLNTTGSQTVTAYRRTGSYVGNEMNASAWSLWGNITVNVNQAGDFVVLDLPDVVLNPSDTMGVYLHMQNSASNLSYRSSAQPINYGNNELQVTRGSGIAYTFGTVYYPRNFSGEVFYHFGFNANGKCATSRVPVSAILSEPSINLGNDTVINWNASIALSTDKTYESYLWSNNSTNKTLIVDSSNYSLGPNLIWLEVTDNYSCLTSDSILVTFSKFTSIEEFGSIRAFVYPNPFEDFLSVQLSRKNNRAEVLITNLSGQIVYEEYTSQAGYFNLDLSDLSNGLYFISVVTENGQFKTKILKR